MSLFGDADNCNTIRHLDAKLATCMKPLNRCATNRNIHEKIGNVGSGSVDGKDAQ